MYMERERDLICTISRIIITSIITIIKVSERDKWGQH